MRYLEGNAILLGDPSLRQVNVLPFRKSTISFIPKILRDSEIEHCPLVPFAGLSQEALMANQNFSCFNLVSFPQVCYYCYYFFYSDSCRSGGKLELRWLWARAIAGASEQTILPHQAEGPGRANCEEEQPWGIREPGKGMEKRAHKLKNRELCESLKTGVRLLMRN